MENGPGGVQKRGACCRSAEQARWILFEEGVQDDCRVYVITWFDVLVVLAHWWPLEYQLLINRLYCNRRATILVRGRSSTES